MSEHTLKTWPAYFRELWNRDKTFEVRKNDRDFKVGDTLVLREYEPENDWYSGREVHCHVTYIMAGGRLGVSKAYCVLAFRVTKMWIRPDLDDVPHCCDKWRQHLGGECSYSKNKPVLSARAAETNCIYCHDGRALKRGQVCMPCGRTKRRSRRNQA